MCIKEEVRDKNILRFLDWKIKGKVIPLTMTGDLGRGRRFGLL